MGWLFRLLSRRARNSQRESMDATRSANQSHIRAEADLAQAMEHGAEAAELAQTLRDHNAANSYDDWLTGIVRR